MAPVKVRHLLALACVLVALVVLSARDRVGPSWLRGPLYWILLGTAVYALIRRSL